MHTQIIASILNSLGFITRATSNGVVVSLNRPITCLEVQEALWQEFEGIHFNVWWVSTNSVMVKE